MNFTKGELQYLRSLVSKHHSTLKGASQEKDDATDMYTILNSAIVSGDYLSKDFKTIKKKGIPQINDDVNNLF